MQATSDKIIRLLVKFNIKTVQIPAETANLWRPAKDDIGLKVLGICCIPCECSKVYFG
jgi:hypothetical protein